MAGLSDLTSPEAVRAALEEFDQVGREAFLSKYGFRPARSYFLTQSGKRYDSKAVVGAAYGIQHPDRGPLAGKDFVGGDATVRLKLESLGFKVTSDAEYTSAIYASDRLEIGKIYPREELIDMFAISDATINNGVFRPSGHHSVWLFVTRDKTTDRTQYRDSLEGDLLRWEGQTSGRTDSKVVYHVANGDELLVFYRESKRQHPKAGFRFEGAFRYLSHVPGNPSRFILQRADKVSDEIAHSEVVTFDPENVEDGRKKVLTAIARRQGQRAFRRGLMKAFGGQCAFTRCAVEPLLEAAHIRSYLGPETNHITNGLLLRADIHTLFDLGLLALDERYRVLISDRLAGTEYEKLVGLEIHLPSKADERPSPKSLAWHRKEHFSG